MNNVQLIAYLVAIHSAGNDCLGFVIQKQSSLLNRTISTELYLTLKYCDSYRLQIQSINKFILSYEKGMIVNNKLRFII